jgi:hypothetical protein
MKIHTKFEFEFELKLDLKMENIENRKKNEKEKDKNLTWALEPEFGPTRLSLCAAHQLTSVRRHAGPACQPLLTLTRALRISDIRDPPVIRCLRRALLLSATPTDTWARLVTRSDARRLVRPHFTLTARRRRRHGRERGNLLPSVRTWTPGDKRDPRDPFLRPQPSRASLDFPKRFCAAAMA